MTGKRNPHELNATTIIALDAAMAALARRTGRIRGIEDLLRAWKKNVAEFEQGYTVGLDDYTNDLGPRQSLHEVLDAASGEARDQLSKVVGELDARFMRCTVPVTPAVVPSDEPWAQRVPARRSRELDEDLQDRGYRLLP